MSKVLPRNNIAFFRFDHRGCGSSQGLFVEDTSLETRTRDFCAAVGHVLEMGVTSDRIALFGSSMGGATCINAWQRLEQTGRSPQGAVLCAAPVISTTIKNIPFEANDNRPALPLSFFEKNLLFDLSAQTVALHHVMLFHGDADEIVPKENADKIFAAMQSPKERVIHPGGDHQMTDRIIKKILSRKWLNGLSPCSISNRLPS